jgi:chromosome segregation ATPase
MFDETTYQQLILKSIESSARMETRLSSMDASIFALRGENEKILTKISESIEKLATIQEKLSQNHDAHVTIHKRIDDVKEETEELEDTFSLLSKNCKGYEHAEVLTRVIVVEKKLKDLTDSIKWVNYKIKGVPIWLGLLGLVLLGFTSDVINNQFNWIHQAVIQFSGK